MDCNDTLREQLARRLAAFPVNLAPAGAGRAAAVAVAVTDAGLGADLSGMPRYRRWRADAALILTRRSLQLRAHAGQWALPGGRIEAGERPQQTALREMHEEIGLALDETAVIGRLDDFVTRSGFVMTPIVIWAGSRESFRPDPAEVESVHRIPVREFLRADAPLLEPGEDPARPVLRMPVGDSWIAAPTAAILLQFREVCLLGLATRVAHYDQPDFAWR
ncbi:MAG: CoA pyrophosphatase [Gammaproteobacteria bacterium]|nr:CoA pyrophosphatase [Gammaproteobacteria bacterium]